MMSFKLSSIIEKVKYSVDFEEIDHKQMIIRSYGNGNNTLIQINEIEIRKLRRFLTQQLRALKETA